MDPTGTPMDGRHHQPSGEPKEVVSPESGICSPLSWQGDGEDMAANTNTASPPLQPGSYPRRQDVSTGVYILHGIPCSGGGEKIKNKWLEGKKM